MFFATNSFFLADIYYNKAIVTLDVLVKLCGIIWSQNILIMAQKFTYFFLTCLLVYSDVFSQCPAGNYNNTGFFVGFEMPTTPGIANEKTAAAAWGGDYYLFNVVAGNTYYFRTCFSENNGINTVLSLYNATGTSLITYNDDFCGLLSQISWVATFSGQVRLSYYQSGCTTGFIDTKLGVYYTSACSSPSIISNPINTSSCTSLSAGFSVSTSGTVTGYQWQVNDGSGFVNIVNGPIYVNYNSTALGISPATSSMNGYTYRCIVSNSCGSATSNAATLTVSPNIWTGANSNSWTNAGNWTCGKVPTSADDVVLNAGNPTVPNGNTGRCRNLSKGGSSDFNISNATIEIYGNFNYLGGTITSNTSSVIKFAGTGNQTYSSNSIGLSISNLTIAAAGTVSINSTISVTGALNVSSGTLYPNNAIVLKSSASASAYLSNVAGVIDGRLVIEKYIPGKRAFRFLAHPFSTDSILYVNALANRLNVTGTGGSANGFTNTVTNAPSAFYYDNSISGSGTGSNDLGWQPFTHASNGINNQWKTYQGIRVLIRGALGEGLDGLPYTPSPITLSIAGNVNTGTQVVPLTKVGTNGYNFIGNPYPCPVDINATSRNNAGSTFYVWDATLGTAGQYRNFSFGASYVLPIFSGFFVNATANGTITFNETNKATASTHSLFRNTDMKQNNLVLKLSTDSVIWDFVTFNFRDDAKTDHDYWDGEKLFNNSVNAYTITSSKIKHSIDSRSILPLQSIPIGIVTNNYSNFTFTVEELNIDKSVLLFIHDKYLNKIILLDANTHYTFSTNSDSISKGENRFEIIQTTDKFNTLGTTNSLSVYPVPAKDKINVTVKLKQKQNATIHIINGFGNKVLTRKMTMVKDLQQTIPIEHLPTGLYILQLQGDSEQFVQSFIKLE